MTLSCLWLNQGKTCIWNQVGQMPIGRESLEAAARVENPDARMCRGEDGTFSERNIILGTLVGTPEFVQQQLEQKVVEHETFLQRIPELRTSNVLGCSSCSTALLGRISFCAPTALRCLIRSRHAMTHRFSTLRGLGPDAVCHSARAPQCNETQIRRALASWADTIKMVNERHPEIAGDWRP